MAWDSFNWGGSGSDYGQPGPWSLTALLNKDKKDDELDILRRYRQAMDGTTSETPADVMKDARRKGFNQSLIALGLGIAKGDVVGGMAAASDAYQQGMSGRLREYASERDARMAKEQEKFNLAMAEARLTKEKEESDRAKAEEAETVKRMPWLAGRSPQEIRAAGITSSQAEAGFRSPDESHRKIEGINGRDVDEVTRYVDGIATVKYYQDGVEVPSSMVAKKPTEAEKFAAQQDNTRTDNAAARERLLDSQESRAERERRLAEERQALVDQVSDFGIQVKPEMAKRASDAIKSNWTALDTAINIAQKNADPGRPARLHIANFTEGPGVTLKKDDQGVPIALEIDGKVIPVQDGTVRLDALTNAELKAAVRSKTQAQVGRMLTPGNGGEDPPPVGGNEGNGAGLGTLPNRTFGLYSGSRSDSTVDSAAADARKTYRLLITTGAVQEGDMKAWSSILRGKLAQSGKDAAEIEKLLRLIQP